MKRFLLPVVVVLLSAVPTHAHFGPEEARGVVRGWYERFLEREPDPPSRIWVEKLLRAQRNRLPHPGAHVLAEILSTQEYYNKAGNTPEGFVNLLYRQLTGNSPLGGELRYWVNRVYREQRYDAAYAMVLRYSPGGNDRRRSWERDRDRDREYEYRRPYSRDWRR